MRAHLLTGGRTPRSPEITKENAEWLAKKKAQREARAAVKAGKKSKGFVQPKPEAVKAAVKAHVKTLQKQAAAKKTAVATTLRQLKDESKAKFPSIKGLADATRDELLRILQAAQGDSAVAELQEMWKQRARARHEKWLKGDSKSAKIARRAERDKTGETK